MLLFHHDYLMLHKERKYNENLFEHNSYAIHTFTLGRIKKNLSEFEQHC